MKKKLLIVIPARSGSTRVKNKNMKRLGSIPLLGHKIKSCIKSKVGRVIVSTNSRKIANYAKKIGAEVPFLRPKEYSTAKASTLSCILHLIRYFKHNRLSIPDYIAILPPTNPFLKISTIKKAYKKILSNNKFNSIVSIVKSSEHPFLIVKNKKKILFNVVKFGGFKYSDFERTQEWPLVEIQSPAIKISKTKFFLRFVRNKSPLINGKTFDIKSCIGYKVTKKEAFDINDKYDFDIANVLVKK